jgi:hypothetical protein
MSSQQIITLSELRNLPHAIFIDECEVSPPLIYEARYKLSIPLIGYDRKAYTHVLIRSFNSKKKQSVSIYGLNEKKQLDSDIELPGSVEGTISHFRALELAGYDYVLSEDPFIDEVG